MMKSIRVLISVTGALEILWIGSCFAYLPRYQKLLPTACSKNVFHVNPPSASTTRKKRHLTTSGLAAALDDAMNGGASDLTNTLARFDKLWKIQQRNKPRSRWSKLFLDSSSNEPGQQQQQQPTSQDFVYLLEPPNFSNPSCVIVFWGGAGLASFPQVAYQEFLTRLSDQMNAAILTAPYGIDLDHFKLAKTVGEKCRKALLQCEDDPLRLYSPNLPVYCLAHSLGCKLASIYVAATGQDYDGIGFISFNNFSLGKTFSMAKDFAQTLQEQVGTRSFPPSNEKLNEFFDLAQSFLGSIGLEFSPSPSDTERLVSMRFDPDRIDKTRLFVFDDDSLDDSRSFLRACSNNNSPELSALSGNHLTPVYFQLDLLDLPQEARESAQEYLGGMERVSFGNREDLEALVSEICGFLLGREPTRRPTQPLLMASPTSSSSDNSSQD